jgi:PadR family transcriptional regulator PadR
MAPSNRDDRGEPRITLQGLKVLDAFMQDIGRQYSGAEIAKQTGLLSGSLYPILIRYEQAGLLKSRWENEEPSILGRPRRRLYRITGAGVSIYRNHAAQFSHGVLSWAR